MAKDGMPSLAAYEPRSRCNSGAVVGCQMPHEPWQAMRPTDIVIFFCECTPVFVLPRHVSPHAVPVVPAYGALL